MLGKRVFFVSVLLATLFTASSCFTVSAETKNYAVNSGFEEVKDGKPFGWGNWSWAPGGEKPDTEELWVPDAGKNNSAALKITVRKKGHVGVWCNTPRPIAVPASGKYTAGINVRLEGKEANSVFEISVGFTDSDWKPVASPSPTRQRFNLKETESWQSFSLDVDVPENTAHIRIDFQLKDAGTVYLDDAFFTPEKAPVSGNTSAIPFFCAPAAASPPVIDGNLNDACWENSIECSSFQLMGEKGPAAASTHSIVTYNNESFYIAFSCEEPYLDPKLNQMERFKAESKIRDSRIFFEDIVEVFLQPEESNQYYHIAANSLGTVYDAIGKENPSGWNAPVKAAAKVYHEGKYKWTIELSIPFSALGVSAPAEGRIWRVNLARSRQPVQEYSSWAPVPVTGFHSPESFGYLMFVKETTGITQSSLSFSSSGIAKTEIQFFNNTGVNINAEFPLTIKYPDGTEMTENFAKTVAAGARETISVSGDISKAAKEVSPEIRYSIMAGGTTLYASPRLRFMTKAEVLPVSSRLSHLQPNSSSLLPLTGLYAAEETAEKVTLTLKSSLKENELSRVSFTMEVPHYLSLINPGYQRNCISPISFSEEETVREAQKYRRYNFIFDRNAVSLADDPEWDILPVPLMFKVVGAGHANGNDFIYYQASIQQPFFEEEEQSLPVRILPPLLGKKPSEILTILWAWWPHFELSQLSEAEQHILLAKWRDSGFNTMHTALSINTPNYRRLFKEYGFKLEKMLPILSATTGFPGAAEYLASHPEEAEKTISGKTVNAVALPGLMYGISSFIKEASTLFAKMAKVYDDLTIDYEFGILDPSAPGYSERNIEMFRSEKKIPENVALTPEKILKDYREEWIDFRCWQNGEILSLYRGAIKKANPDCIFSSYSGYQRDNTEHYGVDWRYFGKYVDVAGCGYGRGDYERTRKAVGMEKRMYGGEFVSGKDYQFEAAETNIFRRLTDMGAYMVFFDMLDGRVCMAASRAAAVAEDFEKFFLSFRREDSLAVSESGTLLPEVSVLTCGGERLIFVFNEEEKGKTIVVRNIQVPADMTAVDYWSKKVIKNPAEISVYAAPYSVKVLYLCKSGIFSPSSPKPVSPSREIKPASLRPVLRWRDNAGSLAAYDVECMESSSKKEVFSKKDVPANLYQPDVLLSPGKSYGWRVRPKNVLTGQYGQWSSWEQFTVPAAISHTTVAIMETQRPSNPSIEKLGYWEPYHWGNYVSPEKESLAKDYDVTRSGTYSLRVIQPATLVEGPYWTTHRFAPNGSRLPRVATGEKYTFTVWVKAEGEKIRPKIDISFRDERNTSVTPKQAERSEVLPGTRDWNKTSVTTVVPTGAVRLCLTLSAGGGEGTLWFDDMELEKLNGTEEKKEATLNKKSVFVIGDSISCYYGRHLEGMLKDMWEYDRKGGKHKFTDIVDGTDGTNGGDSSMVLKYLRAVKEKNIYKPDYVLLNCGLHDIKRDAISKTYQVSPEDYEKNLREIYSIVKDMGASLIWVRTTPVKERAGIPDELKTSRYDSDVVLYNGIADKVMKELDIPVLDLYAFTANLGEDIFIDAVHPNEKTAGLQAAFVAGYLNSVVSF
ncbi:MAG: hypothetical protein JW957_01835 [Candidatus Omnitrophica bacterium]|nr:hypothetical protein [Candidatus Omnitrophota bacterium]